MQKFVLVFALVTLAFAAAPKWHQLQDYTFEKYIADFNKEYVQGSEEYLMRQSIFENNFNEIVQHNSQDQSFKKGVNQFTDLTQQEFTSKFTGYNKGMKQGMKISEEVKLFLQPEKSKINIQDLPKSVDWRLQNVTTPVKNQQQCGSCWAFATTETIESHAAINSGKLRVLSPGQLVQCMPNPLKCGGTGGCSGAIVELGLNYVQLAGIAQDSVYPYTSGSGQTGNCTFDIEKTPVSVRLDGYIKLPVNDYASLLEAVATKGPVAVSVDASKWALYEGGIFSDCSFSANIDVNHAVVVVGYGSDASGDYWIVRNSWGESYGEQGHIRVKREDPSQVQCGQDTTPLDGDACAGQTSAQKVCGQCGILSDSTYPLNARVVD